MRRVHWTPERLISWPIPSAGKNFRAFMACPLVVPCRAQKGRTEPEVTTTIALVTCRSCLRIHKICRFEDDGPVKKVS